MNSKINRCQTNTAVHIKIILETKASNILGIGRLN